MKVYIAGAPVALGVTEVSPTIGITDFSRRETDDFGVTTIVERGFARRMSVRFALPSDEADSLQQRLAAFRAKPTRWIADDRFAWLNFEGFYKEFQIDLSVGPTSFCTLTVEGLAENEPVVDIGGDPAPDGRTSSLKVLHPFPIFDPGRVTSSVPENEHPEWSAGTTYALGARVIKVLTHRVYESAAAGNIGNDPVGASGKWFDVGPTNRWAMFDRALGTVTSAAGAITTTVRVNAVNAVALLDLVADYVRVQAAGYDRIVEAGPGTTTFLDLPLIDGDITVTISGAGTVSIGTLLMGRLQTLGVTEASPTVGINDFSLKDFDEFGEVAVVERAWAKRMSVRGLIRTDAVDAVANRIARLRTLPALWIGAAEFDSLNVYGFFRDFDIEVGENVSTLSLSIEGLSKAAPPAPYVPPTYSDGTPIDDLRPAQPGATNGADPNSPLGPGGTVGGALQTLAQAKADIVDLFATYGDTASAAASAGAASAAAAAAQGYRDTAQAAATNSANANAAAQAAKTSSEAAASDALARAGAAAGSATAAAGSATTASNKADEATGSATAAAGSASVAATKSGEASTFASNAATSATGAAGSASSAASSATVAASSKAVVLRVERNGDFINQLEGWTSANPNVLYSATERGRANVVSTPLGASNVLFSQPIPITSDSQRFRLEAGASSINGVTCTWYLGYICSDANGAQMVHTDGTGNYPLGAPFGTTDAAWLDRSVIVGPGSPPPSPYGGTTAFPAGARSFVLVAFMNYFGAATSALLDYFKASDVTSEQNAAGHSAAAATSASTAAASATMAGQQASAAQVSATSAATSASNAATSALNASTSETNALGSAATASTAASNAANSATQAGGSASAAAGSASTAGTHANNAGNSATAAAASQVSASSARDAARLAAKATIPDNFTDPSNWEDYVGWGGTSSIVGGIMRTFNGGSFYGLFKMPLTAGAIYGLTARHRVVNQGGGHSYLGVGAWSAAGAYLGVWWSTVIHDPSPPLNEWKTSKGVLTAESILGGQPAAAFIAPLGLFGYPNVSDGECSQLKLEDITSETAAGASANAAATSASSAATSSTAAGNFANAAQSSATAAGVSEGNAASAATAASNSASSASGSAASASSSSGTAAAYASNAATSAATATSQASVATAQASAAQQSSETAARIARAGVVPNPVFSAPGWAAYPTPAAPPNWSISANDGAPYYGQAQSVANIYTGGPAFHLDRSSGGRSSWATQHLPRFLMNGWWVMECAVTLEDGDAKGSGLLFQYGLPYTSVSIDFWVDPRSDGSGANSQKATDSSGGRPVQHFAKMFQVTGFPTPPVDYHNLHMMAGWEGFDQGAARGFLRTIWHMVNIRPATPEEIRTRTALPALEATVATHSAVLADLDGRTEAFLEQVASTGGAAAKVRLRASNGAGGTTTSVEVEAERISLAGASGGLKVVGGNVEISGRLNVVGGVVVSPDGRTSMDLNQNRIVFDNGTFMKVTGVGFGTSGQFIEWFGPKMALNLCSEVNGSYWLKLDGAAYFGGTLAAGTLKNAVSTTSEATNANVTTGSFGSNGGPRVVTLSYSYSTNQQITGACPATPTFSATVELYRGTSASGVYLTTLTINSGEWSCTPGSGEFEPGGWSASMGGSLTYTDNSGGASASYFVRLIGRTAPVGTSVFQAISLVSIEE